MLADEVAYVIGVDTHAEQHTLALLEAHSQRSRGALTIPACRRGYRQALRLARRRAPGARAWALEGSGSYAAALLVAWSAPGRVPSEAAFARLAGVAPIPARSGKVLRHRLDRGGDRRLNRALHTIALSLRRVDPETKAYLARRVSEGKSVREAVRCLKRYLARSLFRMLEAMPGA